MSENGGDSDPTNTWDGDASAEEIRDTADEATHIYAPDPFELVSELDVNLRE